MTVTESWKTRAAKRLQADGWIQGFSESSSGACCAGGAISYGVTGSASEMYDTECVALAGAYKEFVEFAGLVQKVIDGAPKHGYSITFLDYWRDLDFIIHWNDHLASYEEVVGAFQRFAEAQGTR